MARLSRRLRWAVVIARLDPVEGHEQAGTRRALVVSYEPFHRSGLLTVCPITAARGVRYPQEIGVPAGEAGQTEPGVILCHQIRTISAMRIVRRIGYLTDPELRSLVRAALATHLGLDLGAMVDGAGGTAAFV
jgi:mRNA interferase MazF